MNVMPALTSDELAALRESIEEDGIVYPVLLDTTGQIIDGFHRKQIAGELGIDCPTHTLHVSPERAQALRVTLNLARRQLTKEVWWQLVAELARPHKERILADVQAAKVAGGKRAGRGRPIGAAHREQVLSNPSDSGRKQLAAAVNADLKAIGIHKTIAGSTIENIMRNGTSGAPSNKVRNTKAQTKQPDPRTVAMNKSMRSTRETNALLQYESMHNAPRGRVNLPFIRHAEQLNRLLVEMSGLDPEVAVTQIPVERCREWQVADAEWWLRFTQLCEARCLAETPDVPLMKWRRGERLAMPQDGDVPTAEDQLSPQQAAVLSYLQECGEPRIVLEIANATTMERSSVVGALARLQSFGMVTEVTDPEVKSKMYTAI